MKQIMPSIIICCICPPIPDRRYDWAAYYHDDEPNDVGFMRVGYGRTADEAVQDLMETYPCQISATASI